MIGRHTVSTVPTLSSCEQMAELLSTANYVCTSALPHLRQLLPAKRYISKFESPQPLLLRHIANTAIEFDADVASSIMYHSLTPDRQSRRMLFTKKLSKFQLNTERLYSLILVKDALATDNIEGEIARFISGSVELQQSL